MYVRERAACLLPLPLQLLGLIEPQLTATLRALTVLQASQGPPCSKMRVSFFGLIWFFSVREQLACCYCLEVCHRVPPIKIDISLLRPTYAPKHAAVEDYRRKAMLSLWQECVLWFWWLLGQASIIFALVWVE